MSVVTVGVVTLAVTMGVMLVLWVASLFKRNAAIVDVYWGPGFAVIALLTWLLTREHATPRALLVTLLCGVWGLRLGAYLLWRNWGRGEDFRYQAMRRHHGPRFWYVSLFTVFGLQGLLMWIISLPLHAAIVSTARPALGWMDAIGIALWAVGLTCEAVGDWQLARFRAGPANAGRVLDTGLWRYTRHPNYFGDACVWWGFYLLACAAGEGLWTIFSPVIMTLLLMKVSGVPLLERTMAQRRPEYEAYARRTSPFFPRLPHTT